jgi:signal transduction histidine kinase
LNTPLAGLRGYVQLMLRRLERQGSVAPEQLREGLEVIGYHTERLGRLVALLDSARLYAGEFALQRPLVDLVPLVERQLALTRTATGRPALLLQGPASLWAPGDPQRLEHLLGNLQDNAVKYSPAGTPIEVDLRAEGGQARLSVTDHFLHERGTEGEQFARWVPPMPIWSAPAANAAG